MYYFTCYQYIVLSSKKLGNNNRNANYTEIQFLTSPKDEQKSKSSTVHSVDEALEELAPLHVARRNVNGITPTGENLKVFSEITYSFTLWSNNHTSWNLFQIYAGKTIKQDIWGFPGGSVVKNAPTSAGDTGSIPGLGGSHTPQDN